MMGIIRDHKTPYIYKKTCHECGEPIKRGQAKTELKIFNDPWATTPCTVRVHTGNDDGDGDCFDKLTDTSWASFRYQECPICERMIVSQHLDNGWRSFFKTVDGEEICIKCYQDIVLEDGHGTEPFEAGKIPGDFFNSSSLSAHGWAQVSGFHGFFINGGDSAKRFCSQAQKLIKEGHRVLVDYGSMGIGGGEGYVTMMVKEAAHG